MQKKVGKAAEPTAEELEFIYEHLERLSDSEVLEEMQDTEFPVRTKGFIKRRRREFAAAKRVLQEQLQKETNPVVAKRREDHFDHLAGIAKAILTVEDYLEDMFENPEPTTEYVFRTGDGNYPASREELTSSLQNNIGIIRGEVPTESGWDENKECAEFDIDCLIDHLKVECPEVASKGFYQAVEENPYEVIDKLRVLSRRKTFGGTCPVCQDW